jgi:hypothetical protein
MEETFSQQYCTLEPCGAGGYVVKGARMHNCLVKVANGELTMIQAPSIRVAKVPVPSVRIVTPDALAKIGTSVLLQVDGKLLNVDFGMVYRRQQARARKRRSPVVEFARNLFAFRNFTTLPNGIPLARELARGFTAALTAAGATNEASTGDRRSDSPYP